MRKVLYIFADLNDEDVDWLAAVGKRREFAVNDVLIREGGAVDDVFLLLEGRLAVLVAGHQGEEHCVAMLQPGEIVGELSFLDSRPPSATVRAAGECAALAIPRAELSARLRRDTSFAARFYRSLGVFLADRLRHTVAHMGFGGADSLEADEHALDEIDPELLDAMALSARRFQFLLDHFARG